MLAPCLRFSSSLSFAPLSPAKRSGSLPAFHHLFAIRIKRVKNNPFGRIDFVVVPEVQMAKSLRNGVQARGLRLLPQRIVGIRSIHDLPKQRERGVSRQIVFLQNRLEGTFLAVVPQFHRGDVKGRGLQLLRFAHHLLCRHKIKFRLRVHELSDQPGASHSIDLYVFTCDPFHLPSLQIRDISFVDSPDAPFRSMISLRPASAPQEYRAGGCSWSRLSQPMKTSTSWPSTTTPFSTTSPNS